MININAWSAEEFDAMPHTPDHAFVYASYADFKRVVLQQWHELSQGGIMFIASAEDPYKSSAEMMEDVRMRQRLRVFSNHGTHLPDDHPMKERINVGIAGFKVFNDLFRGVHDIMGHVVSNGSFGPEGEQLAWEAHRRTMSPLAQDALWCETRGQNAWTNFAHNHSDLPMPDRPFSEQKAGLVNPILRAL